MLKHTAVFAIAVILALGLFGLGAPTKSASMAGSWQVDTRHSDAENCQVPNANEAYSGSQCTGTYLANPGPPEAPHAVSGEDYPGPPNFNALVGNHLTILVHLRLAPKGSG